MAMFPAPQAAPATTDLDAAYKELKAAVDEKKDPAAVEKSALETSKLAKAALKAPPDSDAEVQKSRVEYAKEVDAYADYALSYAALTTTDKAKVIEYRDALAEQSPDSKYLPSLNAPYLAALEATGNSKKAFPFAEKAIVKDPNDEALLAILADGYFARKSWAQAANYGSRLAAASKHPALVGRGYYLAGQSYAALNQHMKADKALRAALPNIKSEPALYAPALFQLGVSDYNVAKLTHDRVMMKDAITYSEECAKMNSPVAGQAANNAFLMKKELATFR
jgi:tetratricopeptide (TPR) repeat protein